MTGIKPGPPMEQASVPSITPFPLSFNPLTYFSLIFPVPGVKDAYLTGNVDLPEAGSIHLQSQALP